MRVPVTRCLTLAGLLTGALHACPANAQDGSKYLVVGPIFTAGFQPIVVNATVGLATGTTGCAAHGCPRHRHLARIRSRPRHPLIAM